jgi:hypothetical protein
MDSEKMTEVITKGIWYYAPYKYNGDIYYFKTNPDEVRNYFETINKYIIDKLVLI